MAKHAVFNTEIPELQIVEAQLAQIINATEGPAREVCTYMLEAGGKRLRPALVLLTARYFAPTVPEQAITTAVAAELIHLASLVHDDVIDAAGSRHNKQSVNARWGNKIAVLAGDNLFAKAFQILSQQGLYDILELMIEAIQDMCSGEIEQALDSFNVEQKEEKYFSKISKKTGKLIAVCCQAGSLAGQAQAHQAAALRNFGLNLGYAFQITDDILDFTGQKDLLGKPVGLDLLHGTLTLPVLNLLKNASYCDWLKKILQAGTLTEQTHREVLQALRDSGSLEQAKATALAYARQACSLLQQLPANPNRDTLEHLALKAVNRHM